MTSRDQGDDRESWASDPSRLADELLRLRLLTTGSDPTERDRIAHVRPGVAYLTGSTVEPLGGNYVRLPSGLILPERVAAGPAPIDQIAVYLEAEEVFGRPVPVGEVDQLLSRISSELVVSWAASWLAKLRSPKAKHSEVDNEFVETYFGGTPLARLKGLLRDPNRVILTPQALMALVKGGLLVSTPRGEVPVATGQMLQDLVLALIGLSSAMGPGDDEVDEHEDGWVMTQVPGEIGRSVVANQAFNAPLNERENWAVLQRCWRELPLELQGDPRVIDLEQEYANLVGVELEDLMAVCALAWAESLAGRSTFPVQLLEDSLGFDATKLARLVELISATPEQMRELVTEDAEKYGFEWSRRVFEERPAVLWPTGHLTIVDPDLVLNRSTGMWPMFDILRELEVRGDRKRINQVRGAVSHVNEIYAREVLDTIVGEGTERAYDEKLLQRAYRGKAADVALDYGEAWVVVEITTTGAQAATIAGSSDEAFMQDLDRYVAKLGQAMAVIDNLRANEKKLTGVEPTVAKRFIPVLVVANTFVTSPITMTLLLEQFRANYPSREDVAEPTVLTLEDLHAIEGLQEQGGPSLLQLLEGRARSGLRYMAMKDYILLDLRRNPPPPDRVRSRWPSWFEPARRRLVENQNETGEAPAL